MNSQEYIALQELFLAVEVYMYSQQAQIDIFIKALEEYKMVIAENTTG